MHSNKMRSLLVCLLISSFSISPYAGTKSSLPSGGEHGANMPAAGNQQGDEAAGLQIVEKCRAAMGITGQPNQPRTIELESEMEVFGRVSRITRLSEPSTRRFYQVTEGPNGKVEIGFDGKRVWQKSPIFRGYMPDSDPQAKRILSGNNELPVLNPAKTDQKYYRMPDEKIDGKEYLVVRSSSKDVDREVSVKYFFDSSTYFLKRIVRGTDVTQTTTFDDYRQVEGGRWMNFAQTIVTPNATIVSRIKSFKRNVQIDPARFEYRDDSPKPEGANQEVNKEGDHTSLASSGTPEGTQIAETKRLEAFEMTWNKINNTYWDRTFNGVDWKAIREKYLPLAKSASDSKEFHEVLNQMVSELRLSHFRVVPPDKVVGLHTRAGDLRNGSIGAALRWISGQLVVVDLQPDDPAYAAGLRKGFVITKINGKTPDEIFQESKKKSGFEFRENFARVRAAEEQIFGKLDVPLTLEVLNERDEQVKFLIRRRPADLGRQLIFESRKLDGKIGYIRFNVFLGELLTKFQNALRELSDTSSLIIDLRANPGGAGEMAPAIANLLSTGEGSLGRLQYRYDSQVYSYKGAGNGAYKGKVILLVDEGSASTAEVFSGGLQENKRAIVIGSPTAGAVLPSMAQPLPTGGALVHVVSNFQTPKGIVLEGRGVAPDITAQLSRRALLENRDPVLERGVQFAKRGK